MPQDFQISTGLSQSILTGIVKSIVGGITVSWPGDPAKLKAAILAVGEWAKTIVKVKFDLDDAGIDKLIELIDAFIDSHKAAPAVPSGPLVVGSAMQESFTSADVSTFLADFATANIPEETKQKLMAHPEALKGLKKMSRENQIKVMNRQDLLDLLIKWGPVILNILMTILPFLI